MDHSGDPGHGFGDMHASEGGRTASQTTAAMKGSRDRHSYGSEVNKTFGEFPKLSTVYKHIMNVISRRCRTTV